MAKTKKADDVRSLRRLGGGRWQSRDERFTIEPQSGTWMIVDAAQTDDLGLPLVRGPFRSLTAAKAAIENARDSAPPESPLADRMAEARRPSKAKATTKGVPPARTSGGRKTAATSVREPPAEPRWMSALVPADRRRARGLIDRLGELGISDPEGIVRQDLVGDVPSIAALVLADRIAGEIEAADGAGKDAADGLVEALVGLLVDGRDERLGVRWRLVDDRNRPIGISRRDLGAATERRARDR
jgi:hypothetical protein